MDEASTDTLTRLCKRVNDTHGHDGGDLVLKEVAATLQATARDGDTLARVGGEVLV